VALDHGDGYGFPRWEYERRFTLNGCFHDTLPEGPLYREPSFSYTPIPYAPSLRLEGFFQSEKYFIGHADYVRRVLTPLGWSPREDLKRTASLHVRRGDYLQLQEKHPIIPMSWYDKTIELLRNEGVQKFLVFSDDLRWCRLQEWPVDVTVIGDLSVLQQFSLTMACHHHILANSTFSWWSAWLDPKPEKVVIAPAAWFGEGYAAECPTGDLFPSGWAVL
jgi:hypothetical protein